MLVMRIQIGDEKWQVHRLPDKEFAFKYGPHFVAMTELDAKTIVFNDEALELSTIRHELFHAYCGLLLLRSTLHMNIIDFEEIVAELMGKYLAEYATNVHKIAKKLLTDNE